MTERGRRLRLRDCADVRTGIAFSRKLEEAEAGTYQVLLGRHVQAGVPYRYQPSDRFLVVPERSPDAYLAAPGDVVVVARGSQNAAIPLHELAPGVPTVVTSAFFRLRSLPVVLPGFLAWYLNQEPAQRFIDSSRTGTNSPILQKSRLLDLPIPVPSLPHQRLLIERIDAMADELDLRRRALDRTIELHASLSRQLLERINDEVDQGALP